MSMKFEFSTFDKYQNINNLGIFPVYAIFQMINSNLLPPILISRNVTFLLEIYSPRLINGNSFWFLKS